MLLLASSLQESISFINEMIKSEYNQYHEYNKIFESQAGYTYKNEITIEMRDNRYVLISEITVHERYKRPTPPPPTPPPTPPPPERVERPFRHNSFMY
ncbi:MAG: hypothetical protein IPJ71_19240 [Bdellovibrionales bacterium]|nr:hypothetical protein [Bdellovibrionales bacterium]